MSVMKNETVSAAAVPAAHELPSAMFQIAVSQDRFSSVHRDPSPVAASNLFKQDTFHVLKERLTKC
jgi:hypothetical protein